MTERTTRMINSISNRNMLGSKKIKTTKYPNKNFYSLKTSTRQQTNECATSYKEQKRICDFTPTITTIQKTTKNIMKVACNASAKCFKDFSVGYCHKGMMLLQQANECIQKTSIRKQSKQSKQQQQHSQTQSLLTMRRRRTTTTTIHSSNVVGATAVATISRWIFFILCAFLLTGKKIK